jgi:hypothetical protein
MGAGMNPNHDSTETNIADAYEARAAALRRAAADLRSPEDRAELEAIAAGYEADAARLRESARLSRVSARRP